MAVRTLAIAGSRGLALVAVASVLASCAGSQQQRTVRMEPMRLTTVEEGGETRVEVVDPEILFREAREAADEDEHVEAARKFRLLVEHFPDSRWAGAARFNAGVALERAGRCREALPCFRGVVEHAPETKDAHDALFRMARCHERLEQWAEAEEALGRLLAPEYEGIVAMERLEARVRRGRARGELGRLAGAEEDYEAALAIHRRHLDEPAVKQSRWVSMAHFRIGEIYRGLFEQIRFELPLERMRRDLRDKSHLLLRAQKAYMRTVRLQHRDYAVVAGYRLGALYERMYEDMLAAEVPEDLDRREIEVYYEELRDRARPLVEKAVEVYERNVRMAQRMGRQGEWARKSEASLARLERLLDGDDELVPAVADKQ